MDMDQENNFVELSK